MLINNVRLGQMAVEIERKRKEMIELGIKYGFTDEKTVTCSQQLDNLLNNFQKFQDHEQYKIEAGYKFNHMTFFFPKGSFEVTFMV